MAGLTINQDFEDALNSYSLTASKINTPVGYLKESSSDGSSVRLIKYKENKTAAQTLTLSKDNYYSSMNTEKYSLMVNLPNARELEEIIIIYRSSANKYKVYRSGKDKFAQLTLDNYEQINDYLFKINQTKMKLK